MDRELVNKAIDNEKNMSIMNFTAKDITEDKKAALNTLDLSMDVYDTYLDKLRDYRVVENLDEFREGFYIRWIKRNKTLEPTLTNGAFLIGIELRDNGSYLYCKNNMNKIMQLKLDENIIFQKISDQEKIILNVMKYIQ